MKSNIQQIAGFFKVTPDRVKEQYKDNAEVLRKMYEKSVATGKKVNGYTSLQLSEMYQKYLALSK